MTETPVLPAAEASPITKLIVAVHGIGDQFRYATIQSVARQIAEFCDVSIPFPLGQFHPVKGDLRAFRFDAPLTRQPIFGALGFAEVFWADIHQEAQKTDDTIEESKQWAQTMIERMKAFDQAGAAGNTKPSPSVDYAKTTAVVGEMIETIRVLENLCFIASKLGLPKFNLRRLLDDYLGAVQLVAEFADYGGDIFGRFAERMRTLLKVHPEVTDIYIVAHSEGTVVTFHGLLAALSTPGGLDQDWVKRVRGYMTIGSPIDKHVVMWPALWRVFHEKVDVKNQPLPWSSQGVRLDKPIKWWNYYDRGDPVGFELDTARAWLIDHLWVADDPAKKKADGTRVPAGEKHQRFFHFPEEQDVGFSRYALPGAAHNAYWTDPGVFGHFISEVMTTDEVKRPIPTSKRVPQVVSWILPYVVCFLLLCAGTYLLYKNLHPFLSATNAEAIKAVAGTVLGIATLLAGVTVTSRIPRLVRFGWWYFLPVGIFGAGAWAYTGCVSGSVLKNLGQSFLGTLDASGQPPLPIEIWIVILVAGGIGVISAFLSKWFPSWGMKPLIGLAALATFRIAFVITHYQGKGLPQEKPPALWPVIIGAAAFLYLWWLAALIFDLVFVWHRYMCTNATTRILKDIRFRRKQVAP